MNVSSNYSKYRDTYKTCNTRMKEKKRAFLTEIKSKGCVICGYGKCTAALDFHHIGDDKEFNPSATGAWGYDQIRRELAKCIVVCANCHREIHDGQIPEYGHIQRAVMPDTLPLLDLMAV